MEKKSIDSNEVTILNLQRIIKSAQNKPFSEIAILAKDIIVSQKRYIKHSFILIRRYHPLDGYEKMSDWERADYRKTCSLLDSGETLTNEDKIEIGLIPISSLQLIIVI